MYDETGLVLAQNQMEKSTKHRTRAEILQWMAALEAYGRDWDETFDHRASYFTQEFWYLLVSCMINDWSGTPLTVSGACQKMKSGSNRTREERIRKAVADGYLIKQRNETDHRESIVVPSERLKKLMVSHFERTLDITIKTISDLDP